MDLNDLTSGAEKPNTNGILQISAINDTAKEETVSI